jgi:hypothetical protein
VKSIFSFLFLFVCIYASSGQKAVAVAELTKEIPAKVFPNPANEKIYVDVADQGNAISFNLMDMTGKVVLSIKDIRAGRPQRGGTVNVSELKNGFYFYTIQSSGGRAQSGKIFIQHNQED